MKLIFKHGEILFNKEELNKEVLKSLVDNMDLLYYQKCIIREMQNEHMKDDTLHSVYGDDFKIGIVPRNICGNCCLIIRDYDENQKLETETCIDFSKEELSKLINLLETVKNEM